MRITLRIISGAIGLALVAGTVLFALGLLAERPDVRVLLAGYMAIGGILCGAYLLFFAISGEWRPDLASRRRKR